MDDITQFPARNPEVVKSRHESSKRAMREIEREEFELRYQEGLDRLYWKHGKCCAGCDHWMSDGGRTGRCSAAGIMSGLDVLKSMGVTFSSLIPEPGFPFSRATFCCGKFRDDFDWSTLDNDYLDRVGALHFGELKPKPTHEIEKCFQGK